MTLTELIARINVLTRDQAKARQVPIEVILPRCLQFVANNAANDPNQQNVLRRTFTIAFTAGVGTLDQKIKHEWMETSYFTDDVSATYYKHYIDYQNFLNNASAKFASAYTTQGRSIYYSNGSAPFTGNRTLNVVAIPVIPATAATAVDIDDSLIEQVIHLAASLINGETKMKELGLDYPDIGEED